MVIRKGIPQLFYHSYLVACRHENLEVCAFSCMQIQEAIVISFLKSNLILVGMLVGILCWIIFMADIYHMRRIAISWKCYLEVFSYIFVIFCPLVVHLDLNQIIAPCDYFGGAALVIASA